jgi:hypothetical protein
LAAKKRQTGFEQQSHEGHKEEFSQKEFFNRREPSQRRPWGFSTGANGDSGDLLEPEK